MEIILITLLVIVAVIVGTIAGFGTSTIMVPILLLFFPLPQTLLFVGIIHWFNDIWKILLFRQGLDWKLFLGFVIPGVVASYLGASLVFDFSEVILRRALGVMLAVYVLYIFVFPKFKLKRNAITTTIGGLASGFVPGIMGVGGEIRSAFLSAFNLKKAAFIFTNGAIAFFIDITRLSTYVAGGIRIDEKLLWFMPLFILASFLGAEIAKKIIKHIPQEKFRLVVAIFLFVFSIKLLFF